MSDIEYTFTAPGGCRGHVTGNRYDYEPGMTVRAPEGEFSHLNDAWYTTRPLRSSSDAPSVSGGAHTMTRAEAEEAVSGYHKWGGWYDVPGAESPLRKDEAIEHLMGE